MRTAVIDIGSNSVRLLIAEDRGGAINPVRTKLISSRLGEGMGKRPFLAQNAIDRTLGALEFFQKIIVEMGVETVTAVATSAVRDASNQQEFLTLVREKLGWNVRILSGAEEAQLSYSGAVQGLALSVGNPAVIDIGGGSTEFIWLAGEDPQFVSTRVGAVRMTEMEADKSTIREILKDVFASMKKDGYHRLIGVGGTVTTLAAIQQELEIYDPDLVHGFLLERYQIERILAALEKMPIEKRKAVPGLQPARADIITAGIKILLTIMEGLDAESIMVSETDIMYGLAYQSIYLLQGG